jgi:hypothetical protein
VASRDELGSSLGEQAIVKAGPQRPHAPARPLARLEHLDVQAGPLERDGRRKSGQASPDDEHISLGGKGKRHLSAILREPA